MRRGYPQERHRQSHDPIDPQMHKRQQSRIGVELPEQREKHRFILASRRCKKVFLVQERVQQIFTCTL